MKEERARRERDLRIRSGLELGTSRLSVNKHAECYHAGEDNLRVIQGTVELPC